MAWEALCQVSQHGQLKTAFRHSHLVRSSLHITLNHSSHALWSKDSGQLLTLELHSKYSRSARSDSSNNSREWLPLAGSTEKSSVIRPKVTRNCVGGTVTQLSGPGGAVPPSWDTKQRKAGWRRCERTRYWGGRRLCLQGRYNVKLFQSVSVPIWVRPEPFWPITKG